ncbi:MAG: zinc metallopeptidase [Pseudomonadota bacterium]
MPLALVATVALITLILGPGIWVKRVMRRYSRPEDRYDGTGAELARYLLDGLRMPDVPVEVSEVGDHYDPSARAVRLSPDVHDGRSLTAITVAAHEVGHALQHRDHYPALVWRTRLVKMSIPLQKTGAAILVAAPFVALLSRAPAVGILMFVGGFLSLATSTLVHLVTLPTELDASFRRAMPLLEHGNILKPVDLPHARRLLTAAALTYVSSSLMSLLNIGRWWAILRR